MKKTTSRPNFSSALARFSQLRRFTLVAFAVLVAGTYSFVLYRINTLGNIQPTDEAVSSQVEAANVPKIDQAIVAQLKTLQDNSSNVQTLFSQARTSPFQE